MIRRVERKDGVRYQVYGRRHGKQVYVGSYESRREALAADEEFRVTQRKIESGELPPEIDLKRTVKQATEEWLANLQVSGSRSHSTYEKSIRVYVWPTLGDTPVARVTKAHVVGLRDSLARRFSGSTVNGALIALSSAYQHFIDRGWVASNPVRGVKYVRSPEATYRWISSREDITRLLAACPENTMQIVAWALSTGMRIGELTSLRWADVDLERRLITVHRGRQGTTKSGRVRHVPILDTLLPLAREMKLARNGAELVFPAADGAERSLFGVTATFKRAVKRAGLDPKLRFHDLRHTFASHWVLDGGDIFRLSKILGHSSVVLTQKTYAHLAPDAWQQDYHRVAFTLPATTRPSRSNVVALPVSARQPLDNGAQGA